VTDTEKHIKQLLTDIKQNCKPMKKSKRQRQIDLLKKLLERVHRNDTDATSQEVYDNNIDWISTKMAEVAGGDVMLDSGGLSKEDMLKANNMWAKYDGNMEWSTAN